MTQLPHQQVEMLIPDLLPLDHVPLNIKRLRFIKGQGVLIYDDIHLVELYVPYSRTDDLEYFAVQRHHGKIEKMSTFYQKLPLLKYDDIRVNSMMKAKFQEAVYQYLPDHQIPALRRATSTRPSQWKTLEVTMSQEVHEEYSGAA